MDMDSVESCHSESEFYHPGEMTNDSEKETIGAVSNEENQQNVNVLTVCKTTFYCVSYYRKTELKKRQRLECLEEVFPSSIS